jgi:deoxyribonuclease-4
MGGLAPAGRDGADRRLSLDRPAQPRIGVHLELGKGLRRAAERAETIGARAVQVFVDNPAAWKRRSSPPKWLDAFLERTAELDIRPIAVHASYLVNLAGHDPEFRARSLDVLASDLAAAPGYGASLVNVHTGSHRGTSLADGIRRVAEGVAEVLAREGSSDERPLASEGVTLVLENAAGGGDAVGATIAEHAQIANRAAALGVPEGRLAFCLDVAHAWGAGIGMDDPDEIERWLRTFDRELGLSRLALIHFNDSRSDRGSRTDRHEHVGAGRIGERGLRHLVTHPALRGVPFVLETPGMDAGYDQINLDRAYALVAGESLEPLPPEAFNLSRRSATAAPAEDDLDPRAARRRCSAKRRTEGGSRRRAGQPTRSVRHPTGPT